jgi:hypothetical protein
MIPLSWSIEIFHAQHDLTSHYRSQLRDLQKTKFTFKYEVLIVPGSHINKQASKCTISDPVTSRQAAEGQGASGECVRVG